MISLIEFVLTIGTASLTAAGASHSWQRLRQTRRDRARPRQQEEAGRPSAGSWHTPRQTHRHHLRCQIDYLTPEGLRHGTLIDISLQGWRALGERPVTRGTVLALRVHLPDHATPVDIQAATVRWTDGNEFGVELTTLSPEAAAKLSDFLQAQLPAHRPASLYEVSPFSYN